ncbi:MAG: helix-turn-helix domain-containing protein [Thermoplasmatota archaeon]
MSGIEDLSRSIYILKDEKRRRILEVLRERTGGASFKEIEEISRIPPTTIAYHLKVMKRAGMVKKEFRNLSERRDYSFYTLSDKGTSAFEIGELAYRSSGRSDNEGMAQPVRMSIIPSRSGPRAFRIIHREE